jgi:NADH-quinone oxidoreductase subunit C
MLKKNTLITQLEALAGTAIPQRAAACGCDISVEIEPEKLQDCARLLLEHEFYLSFFTAVHVSPACLVIYQFGHFETACRLQVSVSAGESKTVPSIASIYQGASWHEREAHDFFGITFAGNHDLKPLILSREERDFKPLLKSDGVLKPRADIFPEPHASGSY